MKYQFKSNSSPGIVIRKKSDGDDEGDEFGTSLSLIKHSKIICKAASVTTTQLKMNQISHFL